MSKLNLFHVLKSGVQKKHAQKHGNIRNFYDEITSLNSKQGCSVKFDNLSM